MYMGLYGGVGKTGKEDLKMLDQTSMGAYVFRAFNRCSASAAAGDPPPRQTTEVAGGTSRATCKVDEACLDVSKVAFGSLEKTLGVYLTWLMHSDG